MRTKTRKFLAMCVFGIVTAVIFTGSAKGPPLPYYGTYIGGSDNEAARAIDLRIADAFLTGYTDSSDFPTTPGAYDTTYNGNRDAFVTMVKNLTTAYPWSTYLGGSESDAGYGIFVDSNYDVYVTGSTFSSNFPVTFGVHDTTYNGGGDVFVTKISASGTSISYSTFIGGSDRDFAMSIFVDSYGCAYVTGQTYSNNFPTSIGAFDRTFNGGTKDAFVTKLSSTGTLVYSTYLGGSGYDGGNSIEVDSSGCAYMAGFSRSSNYPTTPGAHDTTLNGMQDAIVTKLNASGTGLVYSTYLGGSVYEHAHGISVHPTGMAGVTGMTTSSNYPTTAGAYDTSHNGGFDAFVTILNVSGTGLYYSTYLGTSGTDWGESIAIEPTWARPVYVTGITNSNRFPVTLNAFQSTYGGNQDAFVSKIDPSGNGATDLWYSSYLGGSSTDWGYGITEYSSHAYVAGWTESNNFPTSRNAQDQTYNGNGDVFASRLAT